MAKADKRSVIQKIEETGLIPLFFDANQVVCAKVAETVFRAGCRIIEFTNRGEYAHEGFSAIVGLARLQYPDAIVGVGSIHDPFTAAQFIALGADFVVGPCYSEEVARLCNRHQLIYIPGCATVTEIMTAAEFGIQLFKIFPGGSVGGPEFVKAARGPLPWLKAIPSGGVDINAESLNRWFDAGAVAVGLGSNLICKEILVARDYTELERRIRSLLYMIADAKKNE
jgi:2-dehydro-3-deoxyphosphogluconate aldolase/(4S)-4-hydroxy-2-oxoglutarate aldolase